MVTSLYEKLGIKEFDDMVSDALQTIVNADVGITNTSAGTVIRTLIESVMDNDDLTNYYIAYVYSALGIDDAEDDDLDRLISILGVTREPATYAVGTITMSTGGEVAASDIPIPYGNIISTKQDSNGDVIEFMVSDTGAVLPAGSTEVDVDIVAVVAGAVYIPAGSLCVLESSISGIQSASNSGAINSGTDAETDDELRARTKKVSQSFGKCTDNAIKQAVEAVDGVLSCNVIDMMSGVGTTGIIVVTEIIPPTEAVTANVATAVKDTKASGIYASITYPTIKYIDVAITITGTYDADTVAGAIISYVNSLSTGQSFMIKQMERKVLNAIDTDIYNNDSIDISTSAPTANVVPTSTEIIRVQSLTINGNAYAL